ncbi:MAG: alpha/beta hydrolase-fold protein [Candidatus Thorarchaeota archaeon]
MVNNILHVEGYQKIHSEILREDREFIVHVPNEYDKTNERYPVVFVLNSDYPAYLVNAVSTLDLLADAARIPQVITVGIKTPDHAKDLFPVPHPKIPGSGKASEFLRFLVEELIPSIDEQFRTLPHRILYGQSNPGAFAIFSLLAKPDYFNGVIAGSPMLGWGIDVYHEAAKKLFADGVASNSFLYIEYGDDDYDKVIDSVPGFIDLLSQIASPEFKWSSRIIEGEGHAPLTVLYNGLAMIYPHWQITSKQAEEEGLEGVERFYRNLEQRYGIPVRIPATVLSDAAVNWLLLGKHENARPFLSKLIAEYPDSSGGFYLLGVVEERSDNVSMAISLYEKALELEPKNIGAKEKLEQIKKLG